MRLLLDPPRYDFDYHARMLMAAYAPVLSVPFHFTRAFVERSWRALIIDNPNRFVINTPKDWVFVMRAKWSIYAVLARLEAQGDFRQPLLDLLYEPGEARPAPFTAEELAAG
jgi:hypothetical protein